MSIAKTARSWLHKVGIGADKGSYDQLVRLDYPVSEKPRYGRKVPPHSGMAKLLEARRDDFERVLEEIARRRDLLASVPPEAANDPLKPYWNNHWFPPLDACVLMHFLLLGRPKRYLEIGSGNSTIFASHAIRFGDLLTRIMSIDPEPRRGVDALCDEVVRKGLQDVDLSLFDQLEPGDILFFDGSHRVFQDSDVTVFFLEILPRIRSGIRIHVHDIFWPKDYPPEWGRRYYSEQYMLAMLLLHGAGKYETLFASAYASDEFGAKFAALTTGDPVLGVYGTSYWFQSCSDNPTADPTVS